MSTETNHALEFLLSEAPGQRSRDTKMFWGTSAPGEEYLPGAVLGLDPSVTFTVAAIGNGAFVPGPPGPLIEEGLYVFTCIQAVANGGVFSVLTPSGEYLPNATVGESYSNGHFSGLTIDDGTTDWAVSDEIRVAVGGQLRPMNNAMAARGVVIAGIACNKQTVIGDLVPGVAIVRDAEVDGNLLIWPEILPFQKQRLIGFLAAKRGIIVR